MSKSTTTNKADVIEMLKKKIAQSRISLEAPKVSSDASRERDWIPLYSIKCD